MEMPDLREIPIPEGFPEKMKIRLMEKNEEIRERKKLIETEVYYNEETNNIFKTFVKEFQYLFPGILTDEEILARLKANIRESIKWESIPKDKNGKFIAGGFSGRYRNVRLNKLYYDSLEDKEIMRAVIFHELIHALVINNPYDYGIDHYRYEGSNFVSESIVTVMEEEYIKKILKKKYLRVNDYIPIYTHELMTIFGDDLIKQYIKDFKYIEPLFPKDDEDDIPGSTYLSTLTCYIDKVYYGVKDKYEEIDVFYCSKTAELQIACILDKYLSSNILTEEEKFEKIIALAETQETPDFNLFQEIMHKHIHKPELIHDSYISQLLYYNRPPEIPIDEKFGFNNQDYFALEDKYYKFHACGLYGANERITNPDKYESDLPVYDQEKVRQYFKNPKLFNDLYDGLCNEELSEEDLNITVLYKYSNIVHGVHTDIKDFLDKGEYKRRNLANLFYDQEDTIYKCKTPTSEFIIYHDSDQGYILKEKSMEDAVMEFVDICNSEDEEVYKQAYRDAANKIKKLKEDGIEKVYSDGFKFAYEKDGVVHIFNQRYLDLNDNVERGRYEESTFRLKRVAPPTINMSSKKI